MLLRGIHYILNCLSFIVLLGTITAVGGGILRDMLAQRVPSVLKEMYMHYLVLLVGLHIIYLLFTVGLIRPYMVLSALY